MTRLNLIGAEHLCKRHLVAEYKEITQFLHLVEKRVKQHHPMNDLPKEYTLNTGHCKFFMNKGQYLLDRFDHLFQTLENRGMFPDYELYQFRRQKILSSYSLELMVTLHHQLETMVLSLNGLKKGY